MYPLTEFSESKLRLMAEIIQSRLTHEEACERINEGYEDDLLGVKKVMAARYGATITDLREMNVWVLTALQMVTSEQTVQQS